MMDKKTCKHEQYCIDCNRVISELVESSKAEGRRELKEELLGKIVQKKRIGIYTADWLDGYNDRAEEITDLISNIT
jgi:hypothetical protein